MANKNTSTMLFYSIQWMNQPTHWRPDLLQELWDDYQTDEDFTYILKYEYDTIDWVYIADIMNLIQNNLPTLKNKTFWNNLENSSLYRE